MPSRLVSACPTRPDEPVTATVSPIETCLPAARAAQPNENVFQFLCLVVLQGKGARVGAEIPQPIAADAITDRPDEYDVVVVGFGMGGGCAAVEAATHGARVLVLERAAVPGGTSALAGGHFYLGGGTAVQLATGHDDSAEEMAKYLTAVSRDPEPDKIAAYCAGSVAHFDWLESLGFAFERSYYPEKAVIQPGTQGLMYTGNEKVWPFKNLAK